MDQTIKIGVSSCLLGKEVRYNGGHSHDRYVTGILGQYFTFVDVCPEVEAGFGIPRETLRLVGDPDAPRLITTKTNKDFTEKMQSWVKRRIVELEKEDLCGFIFKKVRQVVEWKGSGSILKRACQLIGGLACLPEHSWTISHWCQPKKMAGSMIPF